jgi:uncharacterized membrane protein
MPSTTRYLGILLALLGIVSYFGTGRTSVTALIPAFIGILFLLLAMIARNEAARRHAMHGAVALALLGVLGTLGRLVPALLAGQMDAAVLAQLAMTVLLAGYVLLGVKSFKEARRARLAKG